MIAATSRTTPTPPAAMLAAASLALALLPGGHAAAILCGLALATGLIAALDGRLRAMLIATGIAMGLAPGGAILAPIMLGLAVRRRAAGWLFLVPACAGPTWLATGRWMQVDPLPSLYDVLMLHTEFAALIPAFGIGLAACIASDASARPVFGRQLLVTALGTGVILSLFVPTPAEALTLLLLLIVARGTVRREPPRPANDNRRIGRPCVRRIVRLAA